MIRFALVAIILLINMSIAHADPTSTPIAAPPPLAASEGDLKILEKYPTLEQFTFKEPASRYSIGFGITPVGIMKEKIFFGVNVFQVHWTNDWIEWQVLNASIGFGMAQAGEPKSQNAVLRTAPMLRVLDFFSIGPMIGYELVRFSGLQAKFVQTKALNARSTAPQPFSTRGLVFGLMASERMKLDDGRVIRISQVLGKQTYPVDSNRDGWKNNFNDLPATDPTFTPAPSSIRPSITLALEVSLLF